MSPGIPGAAPMGSALLHTAVQDIARVQRAHAFDAACEHDPKAAVRILIQADGDPAALGLQDSFAGTLPGRRKSPEKHLIPN